MASSMDSDDLLSEILLHLSPQPSSLPRTSLVSKRWRRLVTDPQFLRRFCSHHRDPPVIGVFLKSKLSELTFRSILDPPDFIPSERFSVRLDGIEGGGEEDGKWCFHGCRHGRVLLTKADDSSGGRCRQVLLWDPITCDRRFIGTPQHENWNMSRVQGDVLCVSSNIGHVHGGCHSSPFKVVLVSVDRGVAQACVYSSETGVWGDLISTVVQDITVFVVGSRSVLVGNSLYWFLFGAQNCILELDLDRQSLAVIDVPSDAVEDHRGLYLTKLGGALGFIVMSKYYKAQLWERTINLDGVAGWMPGQTIEVYKVLPLKSEERIEAVLGIVGDSNVVFVSTRSSVFMVHVESLQFKKIFLMKDDPLSDIYPYPFSSFCAAGFAARETMAIRGCRLDPPPLAMDLLPPQHHLLPCPWFCFPPGSSKYSILACASMWFCCFLVVLLLPGVSSIFSEPGLVSQFQIMLLYWLAKL